jgi:general secretion pathway protein E
MEDKLECASGKRKRVHKVPRGVLLYVGMKAACQELEEMPRVLAKESTLPEPSIRPVVTSLSAPSRPLRPQLAKRLAEVSRRYEMTITAGSHAAHRPDLAGAVLEDAHEVRASDIHVEPQRNEMRVRLRIDGALSDVARLTEDEGKCLINQFKALANLDPIARFTPKDSHARYWIAGRPLDLRLALVPSEQGEALSIRLLDPERLARAIEDLGLTAASLRQLQNWMEDVSGMFLAAGPTGSGKTTTVYALLHELKCADRRVVTLEDPVEYSIPGITQVQLDEKHQLSFSEGVKAVLRLDPDFLMIGEIRDGDSAHAAVDAAITGRVLLSTLHSRDAVGAITALRNWGLPDHEIAESVAVIVAQRLLRRLCPKCRQTVPPTEAEALWMKTVGLEAPRTVWSAPGCTACNGLGYYGRTGIFEFWHLDESDYELILSHGDEHRLRRHFYAQGRMPLLNDGLIKVESGITSLAELRRASAGIFPAQALAPGVFRPQKAARPSSLKKAKKKGEAL